MYSKMRGWTPPEIPKETLKRLSLKITFDFPGSRIILEFRTVFNRMISVMSVRFFIRIILL